MPQLAGGRRTHELGSTYWFYKILTFFSILTFKHISLKVFFGEVGVGVKFRNLFLLSWWLRDLLIRRDVFGLYGFLFFLLEKILFDGYALEKIDWAKIFRVYMIFCAVNYFPTTRRSINKQLTWASGPLGVRTDTVLIHLVCRVVTLHRLLKNMLSYAGAMFMTDHARRYDSADPSIYR